MTINKWVALLSIAFVAASGATILAMRNSLPTNPKRLTILETFWPNQDADPTKIENAGDWTYLQYVYTPIVELATSTTVRPALAESWVQSQDGLTWKFFLRSNLRWSDGTPITSDELLRSLKRSILNTAHTKLSAYVESIETELDSVLVFKLRDLPKNFLIQLAFVDNSIVPPESYLDNSGFRWGPRFSGPYIPREIAPDRIQMVKNPYYWNSDQVEGVEVFLNRSGGIVSDLEALREARADAVQLSPGSVSAREDLVKFETNYSILSGSYDFVFGLGFSRKRAASGRLAIEERRSLVKTILAAYWKGDLTKAPFATGMRPPGRIGSVLNTTVLKTIGEAGDVDIPSPLEIVIPKRMVERASAQRLFQALAEAGVSYKKIVLDTKAQPKESKSFIDSGEFDLQVFYLGASEADPDSVWRYYNDYFVSPIASTKELDTAQLESDPQKRDRLYQDLEMRLWTQGQFIPIGFEQTFILFKKHLHLDPKQSVDWGLQVHRIKFN